MYMRAGGIVVTDYCGSCIWYHAGAWKRRWQFEHVTLCPEVIVAEESMIEKAIDLHHKAHEICYIANSVNFPVYTNAICKTTDR